MISFHIRGSHGEVWVHGGWSSGELWKFNVANNHWSLQGRSPTQMWEHVGAFVATNATWPGENGQNDSEWTLSAILHLENACGIDKVPSSSKFRIVVILGSAIGIPNPLHIFVDMSISTCRDDLSFPFCILFVLFAFCTVFRCIFPIFVRICAFCLREV